MEQMKQYFLNLHRKNSEMLMMKLFILEHVTLCPIIALLITFENKTLKNYFSRYESESYFILNAESTWEKYSRELLSNIIFFYLVDIPLWAKFTLEQSFSKELVHSRENTQFSKILPSNIYLYIFSNFQFGERNAKQSKETYLISFNFTKEKRIPPFKHTFKCKSNFY